ncbi:MAG: DUF4214 domain-containing protein [Hyphomonadaceae bacterium]|nr:DUF4214 domain-containing protein [Hyphomonadaceae bacterium]
MKSLLSSAAMAAISILVLAGCGDPSKSLAEAQPATSSELVAFSRESTHAIKLSRDGALLQRYCLNMSGADCPPDTIQVLGQFGFNDGETGIDLAYAFVLMAADAKDGAADQKSSDEDFIAATYRVTLGREPDAEGAAHHLASIQGKDIDARKALVLTFLKSSEFTSQK